MNQLDDYNRVTAADADVLLQVQAARRHTIELRRELAGRARTLAATAAAAAGTVSRLEQVRADRAAYIDDLARRRSLDAARISQIDAQATAADTKSQLLAPPPRSASADVSAPAATAVATARGGRTDADRRRHGLRPLGAHGNGPSRRLGHRRRRPVGDPARHAHRRPRIRRRSRGRHRRVRLVRRPLVPDPGPGVCLGPANDHDCPRLGSTSCRALPRRGRRPSSRRGARPRAPPAFSSSTITTSSAQAFARCSRPRASTWSARRARAATR